jgi:hypothetical protein
MLRKIGRCGVHPRRPDFGRLRSMDVVDAAKQNARHNGGHFFQLAHS